MRIALIHALRHSPAPIEAAFQRLWPEARLMNLLDDSLAADLAAAGGLNEEITERLLTLGRYAARAGAEAILFTCSAFGPCIDAVRADLAPIPVRKPNEAMIVEASKMGGRVALLASFAPTLETMPAEFPPHVQLQPVLVPGAMAALDEGRPEEHDRLIAGAAQGLNCDIIALAQYSMARAADAVRAVCDVPVLTTPDAAVRRLKIALARHPRSSAETR